MIVFMPLLLSAFYEIEKYSFMERQVDDVFKLLIILTEEIFLCINLNPFLPVPISFAGLLSNMAQRVLYVSLVSCNAS